MIYHNKREEKKSKLFSVFYIWWQATVLVL